MITTSIEAYDEYQRLRLMEERVMKQDKGLNLLSQKSPSASFHISVTKSIRVNLLSKESKIVLNSNLPFMSWSFNDVSIESFSKKFEEFVSIPIFKKFIQYNRKAENKISRWNLPEFREHRIEMEDIDISFGEEASKDINPKNFKSQIEVILRKQKEASEEQTKDFNLYLLLLEKVDDLSRRTKSSNYGYYGYSRDEKTIKIVIDDESYNKSLLDIEQQLKSLNKKYSFLKIPSIVYRGKENKCEEDDEEDYDYDEDDEEDE